MSDPIPLLKAEPNQFDAESLLAAVESVFGISREEFCGPAKKSISVSPKQAFILAGRRSGASVTELAEILRIGTSNISRRFDTAKARAVTEPEFQASYNKVNEEYNANKARKQA